MSDYGLQIVRGDGQRVTLKPGGQQERDFVEAICTAFFDKLPLDFLLARLSEKGVGLLRTEAQVHAALKTVLTDTARPQVRQAIHDAVCDVFRHAKNEVRP